MLLPRRRSAPCPGFAYEELIDEEDGHDTADAVLEWAETALVMEARWRALGFPGREASGGGQLCAAVGRAVALGGHAFDQPSTGVCGNDGECGVDVLRLVGRS